MSRLTKFIESVIKLVEIDPKIYQFNQIFPLVGKAFPVIVSRNKPAIQQGIIWIDINNSSNSYRKALVCDGSEFIIANKYAIQTFFIIFTLNYVNQLSRCLITSITI